jgi:hypothetical protein
MGPGSQESETLPKFLLLAIWDKVPGSWQPDSASVLRNSELGVGSVPGNIDRTGPDFRRPVPVWKSQIGPAALTFILILILSPNNDHWCGKLPSNIPYVFFARSRWNRVEILNIFIWKKQQKWKKWTERSSVPVPSLLSALMQIIECLLGLVEATNCLWDLKDLHCLSDLAKTIDCLRDLPDHRLSPKLIKNLNTTENFADKYWKNLRIHTWKVGGASSPHPTSHREHWLQHLLNKQSCGIFQH